MTKNIYLVIFNIQYIFKVDRRVSLVKEPETKNQNAPLAWKLSYTQECVMSTDSFDITKLSAASISKHNCYPIKKRTSWLCA